MSMAVVTTMLLVVGMPANSDGIREISGRGPIDFPFSVDPKKSNAIAEVHLYVSEDNGSTWKVVAKAKPSARFMRFYPPRDCVYSFSLMTVYRDGQTEPVSTTNLKIDAQLRLNGVAESSGDSER